ncbi:hypothetical protein JW964_28765 [candidate division KSB1 bacterium]|nr:hypothetical protein [candidate division KSB1 bacterium]
MRTKVYVWISVLLIIFFGSVYFTGMIKSDNYYQIGDTFRPVTLTSISGEPVSMEKYQGKILFINFYATW